jgi:hypothetical protein
VKRLISLLFLCGLTLCFYINNAQELPSSIKQQLENLTDATEEETEDDTYLQQLSFLYKEPMNLNTATLDDLQVFYFLTDLQIHSFLRYRTTLGKLISIYELQSVPGWDVQTIRKILPFVTIENKLSLAEDFLSRLKDGENSLLLRARRVLEKSKGFDAASTTRYTGDRNHLLLRYRYQYKNLLQFGLTAEKDAGEPFFKQINSTGFDFYSFHFFTRNSGIFKTIAIGDYTANLGQGLIQWQSLAFKKSSEVLGIKRQSPILKPYTSAGEFYFNRGAGATIEKGKIQATVFASLRNISANRDVDSTNGEIFTSFLAGGLYRTSLEQEDKNSVRQTSFGSNLSFRNKNLSVGLNFVNYHFSRSFQKRDEPYNLFALSGTSWRNGSFDYSFTHKNIHLFGEAALDKNLNKALVNGLLLSVASKVDLSFLHRHIDSKYQAVYGNAFTENIFPNNENGLYAGISVKPLSGVTLNAYTDIYNFPWLKFRTDAPSQGKDFLVQLTYEPDKRVDIYTRYRYESKQINEAQDNAASNFIVAKPRQNWRLHFSYALSPTFTLRSRVDMMWYDRHGKSAEEGFLIFTEGIFKPTFSFSANLRLQYFETGGYNSRIYAYENDVLFGYSIPAFFDKGLRCYSNLNYDISKKVAVWLRWAQTIYRDKSFIGSGLDEIRGDRRSEIKLQVLFKF